MQAGRNRSGVTLFLCGDVMTGRGIDQILPYPGDPRLYESAINSPAGYVALAEQATGLLPHPAAFDYVWGISSEEFKREAPDAKVINLETAVTGRQTPWPGKGIHYKMSPENVACLTAAGIHCCALANNHMMDWGMAGLLDTLETLDRAGIQHSGAGRDLREARAPAVVKTGGGFRVIVFSIGSISSGIPPEWAALDRQPGIHLIEALAGDPVHSLAKIIQEVRRDGDIIVVSIHWGGNWGYEISPAHRTLAHRLVDETDLHVLHGHSSHHVKAIEVYKKSLILYGCGDFINDYEGIQGCESFRGDLGLMYFADIDPRGNGLLDLRMVPTQMRNFRVNRASEADSDWLRDLLNREGKRFGTRAERSAENILTLQWG